MNKQEYVGHLLDAIRNQAQTLDQLQTLANVWTARDYSNATTGITITDLEPLGITLADLQAVNTVLLHILALSAADKTTLNKYRTDL